MAIEFTNTKSIPAIVYNKIFVRNIKVVQVSENRDDEPPNFSLHMEYSVYGVDNNNNRHFLPKVHVIKIEDYLQLATAKAQAGDMDLMVALQAMQTAAAKILEDQTDLGLTTVV